MARRAAATSLNAEIAYQRPAGVLAWVTIAPLLAWLALFVVVPTVMLIGS